VTMTSHSVTASCDRGSCTGAGYRTLASSNAVQLRCLDDTLVLVDVARILGERGRSLSQQVVRRGSRAVHIHTSGHASPTALRSFARAMNAKQLVPIHGLAWDGDTRGFPSIRRLGDGDSVTV